MRTRPIQTPSDPISREVVHRSVLLHEAVDMLNLQPESVALDATLGGAGHARMIANKLNEEGTLIGFDLDHDAIERAQKALETASAKKLLIQSNFRNLEAELAQNGISRIDAALFDLGWSSYHLSSGRGFSFQKNEPLLMTYAKNPSPDAITASMIVNTWGEDSIADIIYGWGQEQFSRRIARAIVERRTQKTFTDAIDLAEVISLAVPNFYRKGRLHPATKTFQALRIAVNDEIGALTEGIGAAWKLLAKGGRIAVITFHSVEDRAVKQLFKKLLEEGATKVTKKPVVPSREELLSNPRSRSAKLRVIEKNL